MKTLTELSFALRARRRSLSLNQKDMLMKIGMTQQQYQRAESGADLRVSTLLRILEGMDLELMLVPRKQARELERLLNRAEREDDALANDPNEGSAKTSWASIIGDLDDS